MLERVFTMKIMIGNIFDSTAKTLVNTVNCVGVMGKGIALDFKNKYPTMYKEYVKLCHAGEIKPGKPYLYQDLYGTSILNFPTKEHWRSPSKLSYIIEGLDWFCENYQKYDISSIAFPPLGCGNGGLSWEVVGPIMYSKLRDLPIEIEIYAPFGTNPAFLKEQYLLNNVINNPTQMIGKKSVKFNKNWFLILYTIQKLNNDRYSLNVGRTVFQKICFILTRTGIDTGFHFVKGSYGPYAKEVKEAITVLTNSNYISERSLGKMIETVVSPDFKLNTEDFSDDVLEKTEQSIDLLSRIKSTNHAELITTILFAYDELVKQFSTVTVKQIEDYVLKWKPHWKKDKIKTIQTTVFYLSLLGWLHLEYNPDEFKEIDYV